MRLIKAVAETLRQRTRTGDSLARLGGDEFAVILPRCGQKEARSAAEAIAAEIRKHDPEDESGGPTVSVGITIFGGDPRTSPATVVSQADTAMYAAKDEGRNAVRVFEPMSLREDRSPAH